MTFNFDDYPIAEDYVPEKPTSEESPEFSWDSFEEAPAVEVQASLMDRFYKGLQESAAGKTGSLLPGSNQEAEKIKIQFQKDPSFGEQIVQATGETVGDLPYMLIGGALGSSIGGALGSFGGPYGTAAGAFAGGGFGTVALPAFLKAAVSEYRDFQSEGNDLTFGEFLQRGDKVASKTLNAGLFGVILGSIGKTMGILNEVPMLKNMFDTKYVGKALETGVRAAGMGVGATAVSGISEGRIPSSDELAANIIMAAGFEATDKAIGLTKNLIEKQTKVDPRKDFWNSRNIDTFKKELIKEGLPKVSAETQESALSTLKSYEESRASVTEGPTSETKGIVPEAPIKDAPKGFGDRRITERPRRIAQQPPEAQEQIRQVGDIVSREAFKSDTQAGREIQEAVKRGSAEEHKAVKDLYGEAKKTYRGYSDIYPELASYLEDRIEQIGRSLNPSPGERKALQAYLNILNRLVVDGNSQNGYTPVSVENLIKSSDSTASTLSYGTTEPDMRNILKDLPGRLNNAAKATLEKNGVDVSILDNADKAYGEWSNKYINDEISPYLKTREVNPEELFKLSTKAEQYRAIEQALPDGPKKRVLMDKLSRDIIEERLSPYFGKSKKINTSDYSREIENLRGFLGETPENDKKITEIDNYLRKSNEEMKPLQKTLAEETISKTKKPKEAAPLSKARVTSYTKTVDEAAKWANKKPEDIAKKMTSRSGIRELKSDLSKAEGGDEIFENLKNEKIRDIFEEGNIGDSPTGEDVLRIVSKRKNYDILEELLGREEAQFMYKAAQKIGKKKRFSKENVLGVAKGLGVPAKLAGSYTLFEILKRMIFKSDRDSDED